MSEDAIKFKEALRQFWNTIDEIQADRALGETNSSLVFKGVTNNNFS